MIKAAICKSQILGSPVLIMGICRVFAEGDEKWTLYQLFTREDWLNCKYTYTPPDPNPDNSWKNCMFESQEHADANALHMRKWAASCSKFQGDTLHFHSIDKTFQISKQGHDFALRKATAIELTIEELKLLEAEMNTQDWMAFDDESWAK